jgi:hypothetical protein
MPHPDITPPPKSHHIKETTYMDMCNIFIYFQHIASGKSVKFYGILQDFSDSFDSKWNEEYAYGRMDPISTFQRTSRTINISWKVISENNDIGDLNMRDISLLTNFLYPSYDSLTSDNVGSLSAAPLLRMKFANLATNSSTSELGSDAIEDGLVGYINGGFKVAPNIDAGFLTPRSTVLIPHEILLSVNFTVLHTHKLGWTGKSTRTNAKFPYKAAAFTEDVAPAGTLTNKGDDVPEEVTEGLEGQVAGGFIGTGTQADNPEVTNPDNQKDRTENSSKTRSVHGTGSPPDSDLQEYEKERI